MDMDNSTSCFLVYSSKDINREAHHAFSRAKFDALSNGGEIISKFLQEMKKFQSLGRKVWLSQDK